MTASRDTTTSSAARTSNSADERTFALSTDPGVIAARHHQWQVEPRSE
jgi:hypothetical protein